MFTVTCGVPLDVPFSTNIPSGYNVGDTVTYTCISGYGAASHSADTWTGICGMDGNWTPEEACVGE